MGLDYEFAPIDVNIITHTRLSDIDRRIRMAAFGLWTWGQCFTRLQKTGGTLKRSAVMAALACSEGDTMKLASALVAVGLWIPREDGLGWEIYNFVRKGPGGSSSADRMRKLRAKRRAGGDGDAGDTVTSGDAVTTHVTSPSVTGALPLPLKSTSGSLGGAGGPPPWVADAISSVSMSTGETFDVGLVWTKYQATRERDGRSVSPADLRAFLASWASRAKADRVNGRTKTGAAATLQPTDDDAPWMKLPEVGNVQAR